MMEDGRAIQRAADCVVEATCLLAVLALPLYFSVLTGGYEPDKAVLLRTLACVAAAGVLVSLLSSRSGESRRRSNPPTSDPLEPEQSRRRSNRPTSDPPEESRRVLSTGLHPLVNRRRRNGPASDVSRSKESGPRITGPTAGSQNVLLALAALVFVAYLLSTLLSIDPRLSLWGSEGRQQGLWTRAAYLIFLLAVATRFRTEQQMSRLISMLLLGSVPVVIYAFFQQLGHDVVGSSGSPDTKQWPVWSSFGQHVFFGSYLVMVMPFTLSRLVRDGTKPRAASPSSLLDARPWKDREIWVAAGIVIVVGFSYVGALALGDHEVTLFAILPGLLALYVVLGLLLEKLSRSRAIEAMKPAAYAALLLVQVVALALTGARAAWIGALATVPVFGFLATRRLGRPDVARLILVATILGGIFLVLLNIPNGPLQPLRTVHGLSRVANITDSGGAEGSAQGRLLLWQGVKNLMTGVPAVGSHWGGIGRDVVGYGPETMSWAFDATFPLKLRQVNSEILTWDRSHNIYLDYLIDSGFLGLLLLIGVLVAFFWRVLTLLEVVGSRGAMKSNKSGGSGEPGLEESGGYGDVGDVKAWILIAVAAAMAGHLVDGFFSIETAVTLLLFWSVVAIAANSLFDRAATEEDEPLHPAPLAEIGLAASPSLLPEPLFAILVGLATTLLVAGIVLVTFVSTGDPTFLAVFWLLSILAGLAAITISLAPRELSVTSVKMPGKRSMPALAGVALIVLLALAGQFRYQEGATAERTGADYLGAGQSGEALPFLQQAVQDSGYDAGYQTELAKSYFSLGGSRTDSTEPAFVPSSIDARTIDSLRAESLGQDQLFQLASLSLNSARSLTPLDPDIYNNLGNLYLQWGKPAQAITEYAQAERLSSNNPRYLDQEALAHLGAKDLTKAAERARSALSLDNTFWLSHYALALVDHQAGDHSGAKQEATLSLDLVGNYWPPPPAQEIDQLRSLKAQG